MRLIKILTALFVWFKLAFLMFSFFWSAVGASLIYQEASLSLKGLETNATVTKIKSVHFCIINPPSFKCADTQVEFKRSNGELYTFHDGLSSIPSLYSTIPVVYLEDAPRVHDFKSRQTFNLILGIVLFVIGWIVLIRLLPFKILKNFAQTFAYGFPTYIPQIEKVQRSKPVVIFGLSILLVIFFLLIWAVIKGYIIGYFWLPIVGLILLYNVSHFGFMRISRRIFIIGIVLSMVYYYLGIVYGLVYKPPITAPQSIMEDYCLENPESSLCLEDLCLVYPESSLCTR